MAKKGGLGKGLDSLIPDSGIKKEPKKQVVKEIIKEVPVVKEVIKEVPVIKEVEVIKEVPAQQILRVSEIEPNRNQPRKQFNEEALEELAESMKQVGIIQPLIVQKRDGYYEIIAGERRWRAAKLAGIKEVPVVIKEYSNQEIMEIALIENIQRQDLNPIEEAQAYKQLIEEYNLRQEQVAERVSKSRSAITNTMRLLKLEERVQQMLIDGSLHSGHARALLGIADPEHQYETAAYVAEHGLSARETEQLVKKLQAPKTPKKEKTAVPVNEDIFYRQAEEQLKQHIGTKVVLKNKANGKGKIEIEYYSLEELERIMDVIQKG